MFKTFGLVIMLAFLISGCSSLKSSGADIEVSENNASCSIEYEGYEYLLIKLKEQANTEMWSPSEFETNKSELALGGQLIIHISGSDIDNVNTKYWEYIIQTLDGKEIYREKGSDDIPEYYVSRLGTTWWNIDIVDLRDKLNSPIKVFVIDKLRQKRSSFIIYPKTKIQN
ncbi:MAG: hypothetical protein WDA22_12855 [Bacteroidota bacterium]